MKDKNICEVSGHQSVNNGAKLWVQLICKSDLYAKIYGSGVLNTGVENFCVNTRFYLTGIVWNREIT